MLSVSPLPPAQAQLPIFPHDPAGPNPALDFSRESLLSDEEARVDSVVLAPLRRKQLKREVQIRIKDQMDSYWLDKIRSLVIEGEYPYSVFS